MIDRLRVMPGVGLGVYPCVLALAYLQDPPGPPTWLSVLASISLAAPLITFVVVPLSRGASACMDNRRIADVES
jgi:peptidoglycan/LPS O-acetylase OafA/YrhL